ncbi:MAG: 2-isopropylmalate synthase [Terriglobia bacterium]|jgi:2-isopropylmalate synthase
MSEQVYVFDTTLRDGEQSPGCSMDFKEKLEMARQLERLQVDILEAGFPIASQGDFDAVKAIAAEIRTPVIAALARASQLDIDRAWEAIKDAARPRIHTFLATSDIHLKYKLHKTREEILKQISWAVGHAKSLCADVEFSPEDAGRTDRDYLIECCHAAVEAGATTLNLPDTVGYCLEPEYQRLFADVKSRLPGADKVILSTHSHDDLGLAVANTLAGVRGGARQVECAINGIGERAGNAALEEVVMAIYVRNDALGVHTNICKEELYASSALLTRLTGVAVQRNKAIVGRNAFSHEAGIHQDGVLKNAITYEIITPQTVGLPSNQIVLGKHSGRHALGQRYAELGYKLAKPELERAYQLFTQVADRKKSIYDEDLVAIVQEGFKHIPEMYTLKLLQSVTSTQGRSTATVELEKDGRVVHDSATAEGPCDAAFRAVDRIIGITGIIADFSVHTVGPGTDGVAEVSIRARYDGREFTGKSTSHSVVEAAARAYLQAANKAAYELKLLKEEGAAVASSSVHENAAVDRLLPGGY